MNNGTETSDPERLGQVPCEQLGGNDAANSLKTPMKEQSAQAMFDCGLVRRWVAICLVRSTNSCHLRLTIYQTATTALFASAPSIILNPSTRLVARWDFMINTLSISLWNSTHSISHACKKQKCFVNLNALCAGEVFFIISFFIWYYKGVNWALQAPQMPRLVQAVVVVKWLAVI